MIQTFLFVSNFVRATVTQRLKTVSPSIHHFARLKLVSIMTLIFDPLTSEQY